jgi:TPR repeat protein
MYCEHCGTAVQETTGFCPECGHPLQSAEDQSALEDRQGTSAPSQEELFKAVIGPQNQSYYLERFQRFEKNGKTLLWHWPAFFVPFFWFFYRKMRSCGILYILLGFPIIGVLSKTAETSENPMVVLSCVFLLISMALWPPLCANSMYYAHCKKLIAGAKALSSGRERQLAQLSTRGGTSKTVNILFYALVIAGVLASVLTLNYSEKSQSQNHVRKEGVGVAESSPLPGDKDARRKSERSDEKEQFDPERMRKAAEQGHVDAQIYLGWMYANGQGVPKDAAKAVEWYRRAAEQGHAAAQNHLGRTYATGRGVPKDEAKAVEWYRRAAEQGHATAQSNLGQMYVDGRGVPKDDAKAFEWFQKAAEQGHATAQNNLAWMYANGRGVPKDDTKAFEWYRRAAEQGSAMAQLSLGVMYANGQGVPKDEAKAAEWYRRAAEQGNAAVQLSLGVMYETGQGVPKDEAKAFEWYRKAAEQGHATAQSHLGVMYALGDGVAKNDHQAFEWFQKAAEQGHAPAQNHLGTMYWKGIGVIQDREKACQLWKTAAQQGNERAIKNNTYCSQ